MERAKRRSDRCLNCETPTPGEFCPACGQENTHSVVPVGALLGDVVEEFLKLDSRVLRTLGPLLIRPGFLAQEFLRGRRVRYVAPFKLYFAVTAIYLLCWSLFPLPAEDTRELAQMLAETTGVAAAVLEPYVEETMKGFVGNVGLAMFVTLPVAALLLKGLYRRRLYVEHLVFSVHAQTFFFLVSFLEFLPQVGDHLFYPVLGVYALHLFAGMRRLYGEGALRTAGKLLLFSLGWSTIVLVSWFVTILAAFTQAAMSG